jgi:endonuclease/exonuclease/phosphatase family metal-dependent hydrolase
MIDDSLANQPNLLENVWSCFINVNRPEQWKPGQDYHNRERTFTSIISVFLFLLFHQVVLLHVPVFDDISVPIMSWSFRPSALQNFNYHELSVDALISHYIQDNERAQKEGVHVPPHPQHQLEQHCVATSTGPQDPQPLPPPSFLRTLQWNLQAWTSPLGERNESVDRGIMETIFETCADVLILNEYHWRDNSKTQTRFEKKLQRKGYRHFCGNNITPTMIATKCPVLDFEEIVLSIERSALCLKIDAVGKNHKNDFVWVIGTHLDAFNGNQRRREMQVLVDALQNRRIFFDEESKPIPVIIAGDFNQQRQEDYQGQEWNFIQQSMEKRSVCRDDGVATLLERQKFVCAIDQLVLQQRQAERMGLYCGESSAVKRFNWEKASLPPSTHWSGTTIDYSYSRDFPVHGMYISPAGYSDHRMTVCDWSLEKRLALVWIPHALPWKRRSRQHQ